MEIFAAVLFQSMKLKIMKYLYIGEIFLF